MRTSLIICAKNEEKSIRSVIKKAKPYVDEILVIDGHSSDRTAIIAQTEGVRVYSDSGKGKGDGIRTGTYNAKGSILVFMDADGSHDARDIPHLIQPIVDGYADLVLASRTVGGSDELNGSLEKTVRMIGSAIITQVINSRFHTKITDTQNGFRAIKTATAKKLSLTENVFTIEQEMIMKTLKGNFRVTEIPSHEYKRAYGQSHIRLLSMGWRYIWSLVYTII